MLEGLEPQARKSSCKVRTILESLDSKDQSILVDALANEDWTAASLARELTTRGLAISEKPIMNHKRKRCSCAR
jgi:hypothetical protein